MVSIAHSFLIIYIIIAFFIGFFSKRSALIVLQIILVRQKTFQDLSSLILGRLVNFAQYDRIF